MADLMAWGARMTRGEISWQAAGSDSWDVEVQRFFDGLAAIDAELNRTPPPDGMVEQLIQGPLADALTHVGQLAMLRHAANSPVRPENYARARITTGTVGQDQPAPVREFDGDASARR